MLMMGASADGIQMCVEFLGIYAIWLGILQVLDDTQLSHKLSYLLRKPIRWIFGQTDEETEKNICLNVSLEEQVPSYPPALKLIIQIPFFETSSTAYIKVFKISG